MDNKIITNSFLPHWMELDYLYIYNFDDKEDPTDNSSYKKKIDTRDVLDIEPAEDSSFKTGYSFCIKTKDKTFFMNCSSASDCYSWINLIKKSRTTTQEIARSKFQELRVNVDPIVYSYQHRNLDILKHVQQDINKQQLSVDFTKISIQEFFDWSKAAIDHLESVLDALQSQRPFFGDLFREYMKLYH